VTRAAHLLLAIAAACSGGPSSPTSQPLGISISPSGRPPVTSFAGMIDPTNSAYGLVSFTGSSPGAPLLEANRAALQLAVDVASQQNKVIYLPPGEYPIGRKASATYAIDFNARSNVRIWAPRAILRQAGDSTSSQFDLFYVRNASHVTIEGVTFSQRDVTNSATSTSLIRLGDGGATNTDDVAIVDATFLEGHGGDGIVMDGGSSAATVTRVTVTRASRFEGCAQSAIHIKGGVQAVQISQSWFWLNAARDIWLDGSVDAPMKAVAIRANNFNRSTGASTPISIDLSGNGGTNQADQIVVEYNRILQGTIHGTNLAHARISDNPVISYDYGNGSTAVIDLTGKVYDVWVQRDWAYRGPSAPSGRVVKVASDGTNAPHDIWIEQVHALQYTGIEPGIDVSGAVRATVSENAITYHAATADSGATGFTGIYCSGSVTSCSGLYTKNYIAADDQPIKASLDLATKTTHVNTIIEAAQVGRYGNNITIAFVGDSGSKAGSRAEVGQAITIHYKTASSQVSDIEALVAASNQIRVKTPGTASNTLTDPADTFTATALAGGVQAGRMLAGVEVLKGAGTTVGSLVLRDNRVDTAASMFYVDADGSSQFPDGFPVVGGNIAIAGNPAADFAGGITTWIGDTTLRTETKTTGALDPAKSVTFITTAGTVAYTLADGLVDGAVHYFVVKTATSSPAGTLTPAHMANGTTHTITWTSAPATFALTWDATSATYRVLGTPSGATVN
jgi:hypothetical protein